MTYPLHVTRDERGLTLIELLIAIVVFSVVMAGTLSIMTSQSRAFRLGTDRMNILQNLQFAADFMARDIRTLGSNVPDDQPMLVYAGSDVVSFSADYVSNVGGDPFAVYYDPDAPTGVVTAPRTGQAFAVPNTAFGFPSVDYTDPIGTNSPAEVLTFFFTPDSSTVRTDDYGLFRQVNDQPADLVARNLLKTPGTEFFQYYRVVAPPGQPVSIQPVASTDLPVMHSVPQHLAPADTGAFAVVDSIRGVRVSLTATNGFTGARERQRAVTRLVRLANAGMANRRTCGSEPLLGVALGGGVITLASGDPAVQLRWNQATDESGGENDVVRYVLWRRLTSEPDWGDPYLSIPAGNPNYTYDDTAVITGDRYLYALAAQDCTPSLSTLATVGPLTIP